MLGQSQQPHLRGAADKSSYSSFWRRKGKYWRIQDQVPTDT